MRSLKIGTLAVVLAVLCVLALGSIAQAKGAPAVDRIALKAQQLLDGGYLSSPKEAKQLAKVKKATPVVIVSVPHPKSPEGRVNQALAKLMLDQKAVPSTFKKSNEYAGILQAAITDVKVSKGQPVEGRYISSSPIKGEVFAKAYHEMCVKLYGPLVVGGNTDPGKPMFSQKVEEYIEKYSKAFNVPVKLIREVMKRESGGNQWRKDGSIVKSCKGALGAMQLMPGTAAGLGVNPFVLEENIKGGVKYLKLGLDKHNGNVFLAAAFYIGGPGYAMKVAMRGINPSSEEGRYCHGINRNAGNVANSSNIASLKK